MPRALPFLLLLGCSHPVADAAHGETGDAPPGTTSSTPPATTDDASRGSGGEGTSSGGGTSDETGPAGSETTANVDPGDPCEVVSIERLADAVNYTPSPDGTTHAENRRDEAGIYQVYVGEEKQCISCAEAPGAPPVGAHKLMLVWHPSGEWLFVGGEIEHDVPPWISAEQDLGLLQSGINLDMYVTRPDGSEWYRLTDFHDSGYTGPALTEDGTAYWARIVDGNIFEHTFGKWVLERGDFTVGADGVPSLQNIVDETPAGTNWVEPGNVSPDGKYLVWTLDTGLPPLQAGGMDQWIQDLQTGQFTNLTDSPTVWDEHGLFAPNSEKIVFMSSLPHPEYDASTSLFGIFDLRTEFMLIDIDGENLVQLTHFGEPGYTESTEEDSLAAVAQFSVDGSRLFAAQLLTGASFPNQVTWLITFAGRCGGDGGFD